jgi:hypothetical protein
MADFLKTIKSKAMKARLLRKLLNNTEYSVKNNREYIAVGSPLCHDLISVNKKTLKLKYALDTFGGGRQSVVDRRHPELLFIWDKLQELIDSGQIKEIIEGVDEIENPLPVYTFSDEKLIETHTDKYGWPNTTYDGYPMYENRYFKTKEEAIKEAISEYEYGVVSSTRIVKEREADLQKAKERLAEDQRSLEYFKSLSN